MDDRLRNVCDLSVAELREGAGLHDYDGLIQDLSPSGVTNALARLSGSGTNGRHRSDTVGPGPLADAHDEAHLVAFETHAKVWFGDLQLHRINPIVHIGNLDLACYDRDYAPLSQRIDAKRHHLARWPEAVDMAIESLDQVPAPMATALLGAARGLAAGIDEFGATESVVTAATLAHSRFVAHLEKAASDGSPDVGLGAAKLAALMGSVEAISVDVDALAEQADSERDRLLEILRSYCSQLEPGASAGAVVERLLADHPDAEGVIAEAQEQVDEVLAFTREHDLVPYTDGECIVAPAPESRRWAMAMMAWAAPEEADAASYYWVTPPDRSWPAVDIENW
jgi:hypothetical protein